MLSNVDVDVCLCEGIMGYVESLRGLASKEVGVNDIWRQVSKSDDAAVLIVGFFNAASDAAFQTYEEASTIFNGFYLDLIHDLLFLPISTIESRVS